MEKLCGWLSWLSKATVKSCSACTARQSVSNPEAEAPGGATRARSVPWGWQAAGPVVAGPPAAVGWGGFPPGPVGVPGGPRAGAPRPRLGDPPGVRHVADFPPPADVVGVL